MLHHRQQLDVREAHLLHVRHEPVRQLAVGQEAVALLRHARPRSEVHLVDRTSADRATRCCAGARGHPRRRRATRSPRCRARPPPTAAAPRTRAPNGSVFFRSAPVARPDLELVLLAVRQIGNEDLPDAAGHQQPHRVDAAVPPVEVADDADAIGVRRPDREVHAGRRADGDAMRAELLERAVVRPLAEQVQIEVGQHAAVAVRIVDLDDVVAGIGDAQAVVGNDALPASTEPDLEQARRHRAASSARSSPVATSRRSIARAAGWNARTTIAAGVSACGPSTANGSRCWRRRSAPQAPRRVRVHGVRPARAWSAVAWRGRGLAEGERSSASEPSTCLTCLRSCSTSRSSPS